MNKKAVLVIIVVLILALAGAAVLFFVNQNKSMKPIKTAEYSPGEAFVTNVYGTESLIKINLILEIRENDQERVAAANNLIRDTVLRVMRSQEIEIFQQSDSLVQMAEILRAELNAELDPGNMEPRPEHEMTVTGKNVSGLGTVLDVYFVEFVMQ